MAEPQLWFNYEFPKVNKCKFLVSNKVKPIIYKEDAIGSCRLKGNELLWKNEVEFYKQLKNITDIKNDYLIALYDNYYEICKRQNLKFDILHPYFKIFYLSNIFKIAKIRICEIVSLLPFSCFVSLTLYRALMNTLSKTKDKYEIYVFQDLAPPNDLAGNKCENEYIHKWRLSIDPCKYTVMRGKDVQKSLNTIVNKYHFINFALDFTPINILPLILRINDILEIGGCLIFIIKTIYDKILLDLISIISSGFEKTRIIKNTDNYKETMFVFCTEFNEFDKNVIKNITQILNSGFDKKTTSILDISLKKQIAIMKKVNDENLTYKCEYINLIISFNELAKTNYSVIKHYNMLIYNKIVEEYRRINLPIFDIYGINHKFNELNFGKEQIYVINYNNYSDVSVTAMQLEDGKIYIEFVIYYMNTFKDYANYQQLTLYMEKLRISNINKSVIRSKLRINVSQAFMKCLEIITDMKFSEKYKHVRAFHICEAPGQFILAFQYYYDKHKLKYEWDAQTYNPKLKTDKYEVLGDAYDLIKKNPNKWLFGPKDTGDISDLANINYYLNMSKKYNITTSDCGIKFGNKLDSEDIEYETVILPLTLGMYITLIGTLEIGGTCFYKIFMPSTSDVTIYMVFLMYKYFEKVIFYKSILNQYSVEYYVIGYNKRNEYIRTDMVILYNLFNYYKNMGNKMTNYEKPQLQIEQNFYEKYMNVVNRLLSNVVDNLATLIYITSDENKDKMKKAYISKINKMSEQWLNKYFLISEAT